MEEVVEQIEETPEVKHDGFISDDKHAQRIGVQHKKYRDEERRANDLDVKLGEATKKLEALEITEVEIPAVPDILSETYLEDVQKRDTAIQQKAELDVSIARKAEVEKQKDEARVTKEEEDLNNRRLGYDSNMVTHGLNSGEMVVAGNAVRDNGLSIMFEDAILDDPDGPLFVAYLAKNPVEQHEMNGMNATQLVRRFDEIRPKASLLKPQTSNAPNPPITPRGSGGVQEMEDPIFEGGTWDEGT